MDMNTQIENSVNVADFDWRYNFFICSRNGYGI